MLFLSKGFSVFTIHWFPSEIQSPPLSLPSQILYIGIGMAGTYDSPIFIYDVHVIFNIVLPCSIW